MKEVRKLNDGERGKTNDGSYEYYATNYYTIYVDLDGFQHNINDEPSVIFSDLGNGSFNLWFKHGYVHRLTGPSYIKYDIYDKPILKEYHIEGKELTQEQWEIEVNRINILNEI